MTDKKIFTMKHIEVATLIIVTITLFLMLFVAYKVNHAVGRVNVAIDKIETVTSPVERIENKLIDKAGDAIHKLEEKLHHQKD